VLSSRGGTPFPPPDPPPPTPTTQTGAPRPCHPKRRQHPAPFPLVHHLVCFDCAYHAGARIARPGDHERPHAIVAIATEVNTIVCRFSIRCVRRRYGAQLDIHWWFPVDYASAGVVPSPRAAGRGRESCERGAGQPIVKPGPQGGRQGCSDSSRFDGCTIAVVWV